MPVQAIAAAPGEEPARNYLGRKHPLYRVAAAHCADHRRAQYGRPCGVCWERAIRDDERIVTDCGLPRELAADPLLVDEVAVSRACRGEPVTLTSAERAAAVARLAAHGHTRGTIANLLRIAARDVDPVIARAPRVHSGRSLTQLGCARTAVTR